MERINKDTGIKERKCCCGSWHTEEAFGINPHRNLPYKSCVRCRERVVNKYRTNSAYRNKLRRASKKQYKKLKEDPTAVKRKYMLGWEAQGIDLACFEEIYEIFQNTKECDNCGCEFGQYGDGTGTFKCLDHDHETGQPRSILCQRCNIRRGK